MSKEELDKYGFVIASTYRKRILKELKRSPLSPKQIAQRTGIHLSHVSSALNELTKENIVMCVNPKRKKGRIYNLTDMGRRIANMIEQNP